MKDQLKLPRFVRLRDTLRWWILYFYPLAINHGNGKLARNVYNVYKLMLSYNDVPKKKVPQSNNLVHAMSRDANPRCSGQTIAWDGIMAKHRSMVESYA